MICRPAEPRDRAFIVSSWSTSFKHARSAGMINAGDWADVMHAQIVKLLERPDVRTLVACENKDPDFLYGFICGDTAESEWRRHLGMPVIHYVFVKAPYRKEQRARALFEALGVDPTKSFAYSCQTATLSRIGSKVPLARWFPIVARYQTPPPKEREHDRDR